jgi:4-amino-4-deoxy-L-arabinose transferase-like glycosyltransferase
LIAAIAAVLVFLAYESGRPRRAFTAALWLAVLCPFTANYVAVILTETWATFFTALALLFLCLLLLRFRGSVFSADGLTLDLRVSVEWFAAFAGFAGGLGTLFRPETPLLLITAVLVLGWYLLRRRQWLKFVRIGSCMFVGCILPLLPWALRNEITLHKIQFLSPKNSNLPGELIPYGFMAWEKTWLYRVRYCYLVTWKLNDEAIDVEDIPANAFDTPDEKEQVTDVLASYNRDINLTEEEDAVFGKLASERTARHPLRTYLFIPAARAVTVWLTPRIELLPFSGKVFPLAEAYEEDPVDQGFTVAFVALNIIYILLAVWGAWRLWPQHHARTAVVLLTAFVLLRTAFLTTLEAPEPRYTLVCFPVLLAFAAQIFIGKDSNNQIAAATESAKAPR